MGVISVIKLDSDRSVRVLDVHLKEFWCAVHVSEDYHCSRFSPFGDNSSRCGSLESHGLANGVVTLNVL